MIRIAFIVPAIVALLTFPIVTLAACQDPYVCDCSDGDRTELYLDSTGSIADAVAASGESVLATECQTACKEILGFERGTFQAFCGASTSAITSGNIDDQPSSTDEEVVKKDAQTPNLAIPLPGAIFSQPTQSGEAISSNFIGVYVNAAYQILIVITSVIAVIIIMIAGLMWMLARGDSAQTGRAKALLGKAIMSIVVVLLIVAIAELIDPRLTRFESLNLRYIESSPHHLHPDGEHEAIPRTDISGDLVPIIGQHIIVNARDNRINPDALAALENAAIDLYEETNTDIRIVSAFRDPEKQAQLFYDNCLKTGSCTIPTCNPAAGTGLVEKVNGQYTLSGSLAGQTSESVIVSQLTQNANIGNCPHTSSVAVDVYCVGSTRNNLDVECTNEMTRAMIDNGFCRISSEPWHFELNNLSVSRGCSTSNNSISYTRDKRYTVPDTCVKWDWTKNSCKQIR